MKKVLLIILITLSCFGVEDVRENRLNTITALIKKQDMIAATCDMYISLYGAIPSSITTLKNASLLPPSYTYSGTITVNGATKTIVLSDTISANDTFQKDFYLNTKDRSKEVTPSVSGNTFTASYQFTSKAIYSYTAASSVTTVSPTAPASPTNDMTWLNSITNQIYIFKGGWLSVNPRKLYIVRDISELPSGAINDGGIVLTTSSLTKYLHNGTGWQVIPQSIPFTINGAF